MSSRREFLTTLAAGLTASAMKPAGARGADAPEIKSGLNGPVGLQLYSLREYGPKDLAGTLAKVRAMGFRDVESAGLWNHTFYRRTLLVPPSIEFLDDHELIAETVHWLATN